MENMDMSELKIKKNKGNLLLTEVEK